MREIIFRGQRTDNNEWVKGGVCDWGSNESSIFVVNHYEGSMFEPPYTDLDEVEVYTQTVGQFTGVLDKDENQIFEGDIILVTTDGEMLHEGVVIFKDGAFFIDVPGFDCFPLHSYFDNNQESNAYELSIIGNIYDNQEWLEENKQ